MVHSLWRRSAALAIAAITVLPVAGVSHASPVAPVQAPASVPHQALVRFRAGVTDAERLAVHARHGAIVLRRIEGLRTDLVAVPASVNALTAYRGDAAVALVEPDYIVHLALDPHDPCFHDTCINTVNGYQWNAFFDNAVFGWDAYPNKLYSAAERIALRNSDPLRIPKVAVIDTKIDTTHLDWINTGGAGPNVTQGGQIDLADAKDYLTPADRNNGQGAEYHGTLVAGILAAAAGNNTGIAGIGYLSQIMPIEVVDSTGASDAAMLSDAILYAWQRSARIINLSLGLGSDSQTVHDAIRMVTGAIKAGPGVTPPPTGPALVIAAAGNNTQDTPFYPGSYPESMSVAGTDATDRRAPCSNYNSNVSVSAPADGIVSLKMGGGVMKSICGTSAATPQVSGLAALLFSQQTTRTAQDVRLAIERTADDIGTAGKDQFFGNGRINMERALRYGQSPSTTKALASIPPATGGMSTLTAITTSTKPITKGEYFLDKPGCGSMIGTTMSVAALGNNQYQLTASLDVDRAFTAGVHPLYIRAYDGATWGPSTVGALYVDRVPPTIANATSNRVGIRSQNSPLIIDSVLGDDFSTKLTVLIQLMPFPNIQRSGAIYSSLMTRSVGQNRFILDDPAIPTGVYQVVISAGDQAGNGRKITLADEVVMV